MEKQRVARQAALVKQLECGCPDSTCADGKQCSHPIRRITAAKGQQEEGRRTGSDQVSSTTGSNVPHNQIYRDPPRSQSNQSHQNHHQNNPPLVLSLSQIQGGGGLLILNSSSNSAATSMPSQNLVQPLSVTSFVCNSRTSNSRQKKNLKQEAMDTSCCQNDPKMDVTNGNRWVPIKFKFSGNFSYWL